MHEYEAILWGVSALLTISGLAGLVLPVMPGAPLLCLGLVCAAWAEDFAYVGVGTILVLVLLTGLTYLVEFFASLVGAKRFGASRSALVGAAVGGLLGIPFGVPGIILGPFCGAVIGELMELKSIGQAGMVGVGTLIGLAIGVAGKLIIGMVMVGLFLVVRFV